MPFSLKITPSPIDKLPSFEAVMAAGREVMADTVHWTPGKTFNDGQIRTFSKKSKSSSGSNWHMRISIHGPEDGNFTEFWNTLGVNHSLNEQHQNSNPQLLWCSHSIIPPPLPRYIPNLTKATLLKPIDPGVSSLWSLHYTFATPISPRTFTSYITCHLEAVAPRQGWIITIPADLKQDEPLKSLEEKGIRGRYVAVDRLRELEDGKVEWKTVACSDPRGSIPSFFTDRGLAKALAEDVPRFLNWLQKRRAEKAGGGGSTTSRTVLHQSPTIDTAK